MDSPPPMADQLRELVLLLRDVADCGVEFEDERVKYVTVQIDRETWKQLQAYRSPAVADSDVWGEVVALVDEQAEDEGLWFIAQTAPEAYLQQELRRLHAAVERAGEGGS